MTERKRISRPNRVADREIVNLVRASLGLVPLEWNGDDAIGERRKLRTKQGETQDATS